MSRVHLSPIWRDKANYIINAAIPDDEEYEQLWVQKMGDGTFMVCCIPFFIYGVSLGDLIAEDENHYMTSVVRRSGRFTARLYFSEEQRRFKRETVDELIAHGAQNEWATESLMSVDCGTLDASTHIVDYLIRGHNTGKFLYENAG
ncbi:DUF4265 domain-containing protein [Agreia sp. COWG]|uniref:DUF4265 domain-containing protein n=1 Tax=Agreia sp. COWG TaxID=2773266 RepID=UPI001F21ADDA|nr:DUF4265 domain-containing protein [Agreia sp. COWG]